MNICKNLLSVFMIIVITFTLGCNISDESSQEINTSNEDSSTKNLTLNERRSIELYERIKQDFWDESQKLVLQYSPSNPNELHYANLWPYIQMMAMNSRMYELFPENYEIINFQKELVNSLEKYKSFRDDYLVYACYPIEFGGGEPFYDDNIWVAMELIKSYKIIGDDEYLTKAIQVLDYVYSGWDEKNGGIYWKEMDWETKNTCSNAPTVIVSLKIYNETKDLKYLDEAKKIYNWTKSSLMDKRDGTYYDSIHDNGTIDYTKWTYNTGMMITSGIMLYEITGEDIYLEDSKKSAEGAFNHFVNERNINEKTIFFYPSMPWFNLLLLHGYIDLNKHYNISDYIEVFNEMMDYAYENTRDDRGYILPDWGLQSTLKSQEYVYSLDQTSTAEVYTLLALFEK